MDWAVVLAALDLSGITEGIYAVIPVALPISVTILGVKKGIYFLFGMLAGA